MPKDGGQLGREIIVGQSLYQGGVSNGNNFNEAAEFEIYDRKFKQQSTSKPNSPVNISESGVAAANGNDSRNAVAMYDTPSFKN